MIVISLPNSVDKHLEIMCNVALVRSKPHVRITEDTYLISKSIIMENLNVYVFGFVYTVSLIALVILTMNVFA